MTRSVQYPGLDVSFPDPASVPPPAGGGGGSGSVSTTLVVSSTAFNMDANSDQDVVTTTPAAGTYLVSGQAAFVNQGANGVVASLFLHDSDGYLAEASVIIPAATPSTTDYTQPQQAGHVGPVGWATDGTKVLTLHVHTLDTAVIVHFNCGIDTQNSPATFISLTKLS